MAVVKQWCAGVLLFALCCVWTEGVSNPHSNINVTSDTAHDKCSCAHIARALCQCEC